MAHSLIDKANKFKTALRNKLKHVRDNSLIVKLLDQLQVVGSANSPNEIKYIWSGTLDQYDALEKIRNDTLYFIKGEEVISLFNQDNIPETVNSEELSIVIIKD